MIFFPQPKPRGASLATVMMVVAMMMTLGFTVVAISFNHLNLSFKSNNQARSKHLAEAVLAQAIDKIVADQEFGMLGSAEEKTVRIVPPAVAGELFHSLPEGSEGILTFDKDFATSEGIPYSTNNRSEVPVIGAGGAGVLPESFHLVATARVKNSTSTVEAILTVPQFPYSVASEGAIRSEGGLVVASVKPGVPYDLDYPLHEDDLRPGHMVSNYRESGGGGIGVVLSGENKIYGDLQSSSGVELEEETAIFGEVRTNAADEPLPRLTVTDYDPEGNPEVSDLQFVNSGAGTLSVEGYNKSETSLTVDNGISLNGGVLYVEGDLLVSAGGVTGKGAIISTGNITIYGDGEAYTDNQAALIADGNIVLKGSTSQKAKFSGLIYTNRQLDAENLRLAGVFVAAGDDSSVEFKNTEVYEDPSVFFDDGATAEFEFPTLTPDSITLDGKTAPVSYDTTALENSLESYRNPNTGTGQPEYLFKIPYEYSSTGYLTHIFNPDGTVSFVETTGPDQYVIDGSALGLSVFGQSVNSREDAQAATVAGMQALFDTEGRILTAEEIEDLELAAKKTYDSSSAAFKLSSVSASYTYANQSGEGSSLAQYDWHLDLSEFFSSAKNMEVVYWGAYTE